MTFIVMFPMLVCLKCGMEYRDCYLMKVLEEAGMLVDHLSHRCPVSDEHDFQECGEAC